MYAYTGARLAAGVIPFDGVGPELDPAKIVTIPYGSAGVGKNDHLAWGGIPVLDPQYGNIWTDIDKAVFEQLKPLPKPGDHFRVTIVHLSPEFLAARAAGKDWGGPRGDTVFDATIPYANSFGDVPLGQPLLYLNSLLQVSFALNQGNFSTVNHVGSGPEWDVSIYRVAAEK